MNSIQYQCSCGIATEIIRDHMWLKLWLGPNNLKKDFEERIKKYNPDIVFNFCTKGNHKFEIDIPKRCKTVINDKYVNYCLGYNYKGTKIIGKKTLQAYVSNSIRKVLPEGKYILYEGNHPSCWDRRNKKDKCFWKDAVKLRKKVDLK